MQSGVRNKCRDTQTEELCNIQQRVALSFMCLKRNIPVIHWTDIRVDPASVQLTQMIKYFKAHQKMRSWVSQQPLPRNETIAQGFVASHALWYRSTGLKPMNVFFFIKDFVFLLLIVMYVGTVIKTFQTLKRRGSLLREMRGVASPLSWVPVSHPLRTAAVFDFSISVKSSVRHMKACQLCLHLKAQCDFLAFGGKKAQCKQMNTYMFIMCSVMPADMKSRAL